MAATSQAYTYGRLEKGGEHQINQRLVYDNGTPTFPPTAQFGPSEKPKVVLSRGIHWKKWVIHLLSVGVTVGVVQLSFRTVYFTDEMDNINTILDLLQFAAKLHEILILGSITAIVMHFVRKRLLGDRGLPFGQLTTGYQATSPEYLFSKSLWSSVFNHRLDFLFTFLIAITILYANMVGPSSAIAIIPNLDWYSAANPFNGQALTLFFKYGLPDFYPLRISPPNATQMGSCATANYSSDCPGAGYDTLFAWAAANAIEDTPANVTMTESHSQVQRQLVSKLADKDSNNSLSIATTVHHSIVEGTGLFWSYVNRNPMGDINNYNRPMLSPSDDSDVASPVVQVQCDFFIYADAVQANPGSASSVRFPTDQLNNFTDTAYPQVGWEVDPSLYNFSRPINATNFTWVDLTSPTKNTSQAGASLGALVTLPFVQGNDTYWGPQESMLVPCTIDARWAISDFSFDPTNNNVITSNLSDPLQFALGNPFPSDAASQQELLQITNAIAIDPKWAEMLDVSGILATNESNAEFNTTMMMSLFDTYVRFGTYNASDHEDTPTFLNFFPPSNNISVYGEQVDWTQTVSTIISMVVTEGLSRSVYKDGGEVFVLKDEPNNVTILSPDEQGSVSNVPYSITDGTTVDDLKSALAYITFQVQRYGYGYNYQGGRTVTFGLTILLMHSVLAIAYIIYSVWGWFRAVGRDHQRGWVSSAWGETGEMIALALLSSDRRSREALGSVSAGVDRGSTWDRKVRVLERGDDGLELVFELDNDGTYSNRAGSKVKVGKKYR